MAVLASVRPDSWNFPLLLHVFGAMVFVGTLVTVVVALVLAWRRPVPGEAAALTRVGFWTLLVAGVPSFLLMRLAAEWIASKEGLNGDDTPGWIDVGYSVTDIGVLVMLVTMVLAGLGLRQLRRPDATKSALGRAAGVLAAVLLVAYLVALWAMTAKPD